MLFGDEGFGPWFAKEYEAEFKEKYGDRVVVIDAGTTTIPVMNEIEGAHHLFIVDAVKVNSLELVPGDILLYDKERLFNAGKSRVKINAHSGGIQEIIGTMELMGKVPEFIELIGVVPQDISTVIGLSEKLQLALPKVKDILVEKINAILSKGE